VLEPDEMVEEIVDLRNLNNGGAYCPKSETFKQLDQIFIGLRNKFEERDLI